ncbi:OPT oligopeptide transporter protein-domain-containing protein [Melanogaster broomeanus]|nr:OPT oligopeptide transporter protein-domain-containing protein [Melanogaster broomeanus]
MASRMMDGITYESGLPSDRDLPSPDMQEQFSSSSSENEKTGAVVDIESVEQQGGDISASRTINTDDPFPIDPDAPVEGQQFTLRAVVVGSSLGAVIAASNVYLGLKTGWTFGASLFGSIFGFAILKPLSTAAPAYLGGGYFGPKENNVVQAAASAAGSLGLLFTSGFPAAYQLGLLDSTPQQDIGRLFTFTICCAFFGLAFSIPLRKFYILKLKLVFPSGVAAAYTIHSLHVGKNAAADAKKKTKTLIIAFCFAITLRVVSEYAPGLLWDWHIFYSLSRIGWTSAIRAESWGWVWEWTPAFIGAGMLTGINASYSFLGGSFLAWAIIGPIIVNAGKAFGIPANESVPGYMSYSSMQVTLSIIIGFGPHAIIQVPYRSSESSLSTLLASLARNFDATSIFAAVRTMSGAVKERFRNQPFDKRAEDEFVDPVPEHERVPLWLWGSVLLASVIVTCVVMGVQFGQNVGITLLAIIFSFLFSFIGCESAGRTNINPVTSIGNASQLVFGGVGKGQHYSVKQGELLNSLSGMLALGAAEQAADMIGDLKTSHLLRSSPKAIFCGQLCGAIVSIFMAAGIYVVFSTAYPCINDLSYTTCSFPTPDVQSWRAVAVAVSSSSLPIPPTSGYTAIGLGLAAVMTVIAKHTIVPPKYHAWVPNFNAIGIGFILNISTYPLAMVFGSTIAFFWRRMFFNQYQMYCFAVAAGFIAGEGLGGIVNAVLTIAGVSGARYGTSIGCPGGVYCG